MDKINKYKVDDIVYSVSINEFLIININKLKVESFFFNNLPEYNIFIYSCLGLGNKIDRTNELSLTEEEIQCEKNNDWFEFSCFEFKRKRDPSKAISSSAVESYLYFEHELEEVIQEKLKERIKQNDLK